MYEYCDKVTKRAEKRIIQLFMRQKSVLAFDRMNILGSADTLYAELDGYCREALLLIAQRAYRDCARQMKKDKVEQPLFVGENINNDWLIEFLLDYDPITGYVYAHEVDRKKQRYVESVIAKAEHDMPITDEPKKAMKLWIRQFRQIAIETVDRATLQAMQDYGIKYVKWITQLDGKVCAECKVRNGKVFPIDKIPPKAHIGCRCYLIPYYKKNE